MVQLLDPSCRQHILVAPQIDVHVSIALRSSRSRLVTHHATARHADPVRGCRRGKRAHHAYLHHRDAGRRVSTDSSRTEICRRQLPEVAVPRVANARVPIIEQGGDICDDGRREGDPSQSSSNLARAETVWWPGTAGANTVTLYSASRLRLVWRRWCMW